MNKIYKFLATLLLFSGYCFAQDNKEVALQKGTEAVKLMDEGKIEESILLLQESQKLDPENFNYPYETAYANYLKGDYKKTIEVLEKLENYKDKQYVLYTLWGNSYDALNNPEKAIEIYDKGLKIYPDKGHLYLEKGVVYELEKDYNQAVEMYKKGISVEPEYSSNYYRIANLYLNSDNKVPGLIYGEIFVNLERTTKRTTEMSQNLFEAYKNSVVIENGKWKELDFCKEIKIDVAQYEKDKKLPLCMVFVKSFIFGMLNSNTKKFNLDSLSKMRQGFLTSYFEKDHKDYPNILFDYQKQMLNNKVFDAYNHYIFQMGAETEFSDWLKTHEAEYNTFVDWYTQNQNIISPTKQNYFEFKN